MHNYSYENEYNLHVNEISFSYERLMDIKTRFEKEARGNSEMAYNDFTVSSMGIMNIRKTVKLVLAKLVARHYNAQKYRVEQMLSSSERI